MICAVSGCISMDAVPEKAGGRYGYSYTMVQPIENRDLIYRDSYMTLQFSIDQSVIAFHLQNNSDQSISIVWEKASIGIKNEIFSVRNYKTFYSERDDPPYPLVIPPNGFIREVVIPWNNSYQKNGAWVERELFPAFDAGADTTKDSTMNLVGSEITLVLPMKVGLIVLDNSFVFKVTGVNILSSDTTLQPLNRPPKPEQSKEKRDIVQDITPVIISAGILGVAMYFLSVKKSPPISF